MISTATGPGSLYLTGEEELTYEWYREVVYSRHYSGQSSATLYLPKEWGYKRVKVVRLDP